MLQILITAIVAAFTTALVVVQVQDENSVLESGTNTTEITETQTEQRPAPVETKIIDSDIASERLVLNLSSQNLTKVQMSVFDKTYLEELNLANNQLTGALPAEVRHLVNLKVLNLSNNQFTGVPAEVGQLKNLEVLDLSNNQLTGLPNELGNLSKLKVLNLKGNNYSTTDLNVIKSKLPSSVQILVD